MQNPPARRWVFSRTIDRQFIIPANVAYTGGRGARWRSSIVLRMKTPSGRQLEKQAVESGLLFFHGLSAVNNNYETSFRETKKLQRNDARRFYSSNETSPFPARLDFN